MGRGVIVAILTNTFIGNIAQIPNPIPGPKGRNKNKRMKDNINFKDIQDQIKVMDYAFTGLKNFREAIGLDQSEGVTPFTEPPADEAGNVEPGDLYERMTPEAQEENDNETRLGL